MPFRKGQPHGKTSPLPRLALHFERSIVLAHNAKGYGQTKARPLAHGLEAEKRIKYPAKVLGFNTLARVAHAQLRHTRRFIHRGGDMHFTLAVHGLSRIEQEVDQHLLHALGVHGQLQPFRHVHRYLHRSAHIVPHQANGPAHKAGQIMPIGEGELKDWVLVAHLSWAWAREVEEFILSGEGSDTNTKIMVLGADGSVILGGDNNEKPLALPLLQELEHSTSAWAVETWPDGIAYLTAAVSCTGFKDYDGLQWSVVARQSLDAAYEPVRRLVARILVAGLLLAVLFALVAGYIAQRTIAPLKALTAAADRLSRGERVTIPRNRGIREIEVLSASLSTLVENLTRTEKDRNRIQHG